jgi:hypothetical protein
VRFGSNVAEDNKYENVIRRYNDTQLIYEQAILNKQYKQLQAQIALEEAQNAKSVVRLSRDNEGNYGYVYTAD